MTNKINTEEIVQEAVRYAQNHAANRPLALCAEKALEYYKAQLYEIMDGMKRPEDNLNCYAGEYVVSLKATNQCLATLREKIDGSLPIAK